MTKCVTNENQCDLGNSNTQQAWVNPAKLTSGMQKKNPVIYIYFLKTNESNIGLQGQL